MAGVLEVGNVDQPDENTNNSNNLGELVSKVVELLFQGRRLRDLRRDALVDIANSCVRACQDNHSLGVTSNNGSTGEEDVDLILQDSLVVAQNCPAVLANTLALASKDGLVNGEAVAFDGNQPAVCGNPGANRDIDNIAWNELLGLDAVNLPIAHNVGLVRRVLLERSNGLLSATLLRDSHDRVENQDSQDDGRVDESAPSPLLFEQSENKRNSSRAEKNNDELIFELFKDEFPYRCRGFFGDSCMRNL